MATPEKKQIPEIYICGLCHIILIENLFTCSFLTTNSPAFYLISLFFQHLCSIHEAANSEEMQEFLAINTDDRIAFVKKPFIVSRIDKVFSNPARSVSKIYRNILYVS